MVKKYLDQRSIINHKSKKSNESVYNKHDVINNISMFITYLFKNIFARNIIARKKKKIFCVHSMNNNI